MPGARSGPPESQILSVHAYVPERVISNDDLERLTGMPQGEIEARTGLLERRYADPSATPTDLGVKAALGLFEQTGVDRRQIDTIISASSSRDQAIPTDAMRYANRLDIVGARCLTLDAVCASYLYALEVADLYIRTRRSEKVLVLCAEKTSAVLNYRDPASSVIFGDAGTATVLVPNTGDSRLEYSHFETDARGDAIDLVQIKGGGLRFPPNNPSTRPEMNLFEMKGPQVFREAMKGIPCLLAKLLAGACTSLDSIDWVIPHQVNPQMLTRVLRRAGRGRDIDAGIVYCNNRLGNCAAATFPVAMADLLRQQKLRRGHRVMLIGAAVGFTLCGMVLVY